MTYAVPLDVLIDKAAAAQRKEPSLRYGQALMNCLATMDMEVHNAIAGTDADPFYLDSRIGRFYTALAELGPGSTGGKGAPATPDPSSAGVEDRFGR